MQDPPTLAYLFLERPLSLSLALLGVAVVLAILARRRNRPRLLIGAGAALILAAGVWALAAAVTTDRERVMQRTEALLQATAPLDTAALGDLLDPAATLRGPDGSVWLERESLLAALALSLERWQVETQDVRNLQAGVGDRNDAASRVEARTSFREGSGLPVRTTWQLQWRRDADGRWRVIDVQWLEFQGRTPQEGMWR